MRKLIFFFFILPFFFFASKAEAQSIYGVSPYNEYLAEINIDNLEVVSETMISMAGYTITGGNGLAWSPNDGELYDWNENSKSWVERV